MKCEQIGILTSGKWERMKDQCRRVYSTDGLCPTLVTPGGGHHEVKIFENKKCDKKRI